jgi:hypothetical protein
MYGNRCTSRPHLWPKCATQNSAELPPPPLRVARIPGCVPTCVLLGTQLACPAREGQAVWRHVTRLIAAAPLAHPPVEEPGKEKTLPAV